MTQPVSSNSLTSSVAPLTRHRSYRDHSPPLAHPRKVSPHSAHTGDTFEMGSLAEAGSLAHEGGPCNHAAQIDALTRRIGELEARLPIQNDQPSKFYQGVADGLWYLGHVIGIGSLLSRISLPAAAALVVTGQALTIASRPIGRLRERVRGASDDTV